MEAVADTMEFFRIGPNANKRNTRHVKAVFAIILIASILLPCYVEARPAARKSYQY